MSGEWAAFVAVLAEMPDVIERLAADHAPDANGRCPSCTTPGRGTSHVVWPCSLANLAADARRVGEEARPVRIGRSVGEVGPVLPAAGGAPGPAGVVRSPCARSSA